MRPAQMLRRLLLVYCDTAVLLPPDRTNPRRPPPAGQLLKKGFAMSADAESPIDVAATQLADSAATLAPAARADGQCRAETLLAIAWRTAVLRRFAHWTSAPEYKTARRLCAEAKPGYEDDIIAAESYLLHKTPIGDVGAVFAMMGGCRPLWLAYWGAACEALARQAAADAERKFAQ